MPSRSSATALILTVVITAAGCTSAPSAGQAGSPSAATPTAAAASSGGRPDCPAVPADSDPKAAWESAASALEAASTSTYRVQSETSLPTGGVTSFYTAKVDELRGRAEFSGTFASRKNGDVPRITLVVDGDDAFLQSAGWTDSRRGKWLRATPSSLAEAEIPLSPDPPSKLPQELARFRPHAVMDWHGSLVISGQIPARDGLSLLGLTQHVGGDRELMRSLTGRFGVSAKLDNNGCVGQFEVNGQNARVSGSSKAVSAADLDTMIRSSRARIFISAVGTPVTITIPEPSLVLGAGGI